MYIRKATPADVDAVAQCILLAMQEIIFSLIGERNPAKAFAFIMHFVAKSYNQYAYTNCWVVQLDEKVVAVANVYNGAELIPLRQPILDYLQKRHRFSQVLEAETEAGEYYLDSLGVLTAYQGQGIGTALLSFLCNEYVFRQKQVLGLLVEEQNHTAMQLYLRLGFRFADTKTLLGKILHHLQLAAQTAGK